MSEYLDLLQNSEFLRLALELVLIPLLLSGEEFGLIRWLNWFKDAANLSGKKILGFPVMKIVAAVASVAAALVVSFVDGVFTDTVPEPGVVVTMIVAFFTLSQSWYSRIASDVDLTRLEEDVRGGGYIDFD